MQSPQILLADSRGQYIPRDFFTGFDLSKWGLDPDDYRELSDPYNEGYWDTWDELLRKATYIDGDGLPWELYQDGDLFAVCLHRMNSLDKLNFFGNNPEDYDDIEVLPAHWVRPLLMDDFEGLDAQERAEFDAWCRSNTNMTVTASGSSYVGYFNGVRTIVANFIVLRK